MSFKFQQVLFATETFAMGVNMPAKTVVFDSITKYDGSNFRHLLPTEYVQMAGRSGRRGHDDIGTVIILCKQKIPIVKDLYDMAMGKPQNLVSKFKVTYSMVLHLKRLSEAISVGEMMRRSFKETKTMSNLEKNRNELDKIMKRIEEAVPIAEHQKELELFYETSIDYLEKWKELRPYMLNSKKAVKSLVEGRVLLISYQHHYNKLGFFLGFQKKREEFYKIFILTSVEETNKAKNDDKLETWYNVVSLTKKKFYQPVDNPIHEIINVPASSIIEVTNVVVNINCKLILSDWEKRQIPRFK